MCIVVRRLKDRRHTRRQNPHDRSSRSAMPVRVLARRIQLVVVMRVLNRANAIAAGRQVLYQINDQRCFAAVLSTDDVNAFQDNSFPWKRVSVRRASKPVDVNDDKTDGLGGPSYWTLRFIGFIKWVPAAWHPLAECDTKKVKRG